jgi:hypothetical protein
MQMVTTGWIAEEPAAAPALPVTNFLLSQRAAPAGPVTMGQAVGRVLSQAERPGRYDAEPEREDPDERAANLVARGYSPGLLAELQQRLGNTTRAIEAEQQKIRDGAKRAASIRRAHEAGRIDAFGVMREMDFDEGDENRVRALEHQAQSLRGQIADVMEIVTPPPERQAPRPVEAAAQRAQQALAQVAEELRLKDVAAARARAQLERDRSEFYAARGRHPFVSRGAGRSTEHTGGVSIR